ncbi:MAG: hypothetical protein AAF282_16775 [Cyanobacteria bacterium P01_A01_bin.15]
MPLHTGYINLSGYFQRTLVAGERNRYVDKGWVSLLRMAILVGVTAVLFGTGCTRHVQIESIGYTIFDSYPVPKDTYYKYPREAAVTPRDAERGPFLVGFFKSDMDLSSIAKSKGMHHLGYNLFQCPESAPHKDSFFNDRVFELSREDSARLGPPGEEYTFKLYIPLNLHETIERSPFLHWPEEETLVADSIRARGLCLDVSAGAMTGFALRSNTVILPVTIENSPLRVSGILPGAEVE